MNYKIYYLLGLLIFFATPGTFANNSCNPLGQLAQSGALSSGSIEFLKILGEPKIFKAEINSANCRNANVLLSEKDYEKLQELISSAEEIFIIIKSTNNVACVNGVKSYEEILSQVWKVAEGNSKESCYLNNNLLKLASIDGLSTVFVNSELSKLLTTRTPASVERKKTHATTKKK